MKNLSNIFWNAIIEKNNYCQLIYFRGLNENDDRFNDLDDFDYAEFNEPKANYQYVNSHRDITLPLQKHSNVQPVYDSPETGNVLLHN